MSFIQQQRGPYQVWSWSGWEDLTHGFIGASASFSDVALGDERPRFCDTFKVENLILPNQVHGSEICQVESLQGVPQADGLRAWRTGEQSCALGIRTADCIPLLIRDEREVAAVHAGWRGLAAGIVEAAISRFNRPSAVEILIGPCAGAAHYEVGQEVIAALGEGVVCTASTTPGKYFLALAQSAAKSANKAGVLTSKIHVLELCTITDAQFHSHRRQGLLRGSNLAFLVV